jgi:hypothetical protein
MAMPDRPANEPAVLTSWKEIAQYLGKGVRTVQRWEQRFGLPVRRPLGAGHKSTVLARRSDLDHWMSSSWGRRAHSESAIIAALSPLCEQLGDSIQNSRDLQLASIALLREVSASVSSLLANCRELRKTRRESEALIARTLEAQGMIGSREYPEV